MKDNKLIAPYESIKTGYGLLKLHKINHPVRPIVSSILSVTSGSEIYLLKIIQPLLKKCKFSLKSTADFTEIFKKDIAFYKTDYEVISYDAKLLYTSVNVKIVLDYIIDEIYLKPNDFFNQNSDNYERADYPPPDLFRIFFSNVLLKFSSFQTLDGYFKQKSGLSMGSKVAKLWLIYLLILWKVI